MVNLHRTAPQGLADVIAGETAICTVGKQGVGLTYRGYTIEDLAQYSTFEEVAFLLIHGKLPTRQELSEYQAKLTRLQTLPTLVRDQLEHIPKETHPMDVLRSACSILGCLEPENDQNLAPNIADRLMPFCNSALLYWYRFYLDGTRIVPSQETTLAGQFLALLNGETPDPILVRALDVSLILYAEHEFNASTFAARVCASTGSDFYSCIVAAIGTLRGPLHGGANEAAMKLINEFNNAEEAELGIRQRLAAHKLIMGFGHRVYKHADPRAVIIKRWAEQLSTHSEDKQHKKSDRVKLNVAQRIEEMMQKEKGLFPNLDFPSALVYYYADIPIPLFTPLFVISRLSGWSAHIMEQRNNNRLIRPLAEYTGPEPTSYIPIEKRS